MIDLEERDKYNLTFRIQGFQSAVFLKLPNDDYILKITYLDETTGEEKVRWIPVDESIIKKHRSKIDNFGETQIKRLSSKGTAIQMKQTVKQKPIIGALGSALLGGAVGCGIILCLDEAGVGAVGAFILPLGIASG